MRSSVRGRDVVLLGDEEPPDVIRFEASTRTVRGWRKSLLTVRGALWDLANHLVNKGRLKESDELLKSYSGLAHLTDILQQGLDKAEEREVNQHRE